MLATGLIIAIVVSVASAELGACPSHPKVHPDFDLEKFAGTWYVIEATSSIDKIKGKCARYVVEFREKGKADLLYKYIHTMSGNKKSEFSEVSTPKITDAAKMLISPKTSLLGKKKNIAVIDTDYDTYAITYSCTNLFLAHHSDVHILSKTKTLDDKKKMDIYNTLSSRDISQKNLLPDDQNSKDCDDV